MFNELLEKLARAFDARSIPYMIIGGQAVLLYGEPRLTQDIDVTLGATPEERLSDVLAAAAEAGCLPLVEDPAAFAAQTMVLPCATQGGLRVDLIFSFTPYEQQAIQRATAVRIAETLVKYARLEDLVIHKVFAGRPRDLDDARLILLRHPDADMGYIRAWLTRFENDMQIPFLDRFERLLK